MNATNDQGATPILDACVHNRRSVALLLSEHLGDMSSAASSALLEGLGSELSEKSVCFYRDNWPKEEEQEHDELMLDIVHKVLSRGTTATVSLLPMLDAAVRSSSLHAELFFKLITFSVTSRVTGTPLHL